MNRDQPNPHAVFAHQMRRFREVLRQKAKLYEVAADSLTPLITSVEADAVAWDLSAGIKQDAAEPEEARA